jgi:hypothetical protein
MGRYFILSDDNIFEEPNYETWSQWYQNTFDKISQIEHTETDQGTVETRFVAMTMSLNKEAPPLLFETKVTGGWLDGHTEKFATLDEARAGHDACVQKVREEEQENQVPPPGAGW